MKKSKFIEMLNQTPGDVEIKFWNGFVGDWVDLQTKLIPVSLVKKTESYYLESVRQQRCIANKNWEYQLPIEEIDRLKNLYKKVCVWEDNQFVTQEDIKEGRYAAKVVYMLQAKVKGVDTWDRAGNISY